MPTTDAVTHRSGMPQIRKSEIKIPGRSLKNASKEEWLVQVLPGIAGTPSRSINRADP